MMFKPGRRSWWKSCHPLASTIAVEALLVVRPEVFKGVAVNLCKDQI